MDSDIIFNKLMQHLQKKGVNDTEYVIKAYETAKRLHDGQFRKGGEPYIIHPVCVASILEELDFESPVLAAALLHDVAEDCNFTVAQIEQEFTKKIAQIVDAVTAIKIKEEDQINYEYPRIEEQTLTYEKLVNIGRINKLAFYIKLADRLHNLSTINCFPKYKQIEKVKETEIWILPIAKLLKASHFYYGIKGECLKIINSELYLHLFNEYKKFCTINKSLFKNLVDLINVNSYTFLHKNTDLNIKFKNAMLENVSIYELWEMLSRENTESDLLQFYFNKFNSVQTNKLILIYEGIAKPEVLRQFIFGLADLPALNKKFTIIGIDKNSLTNNNYYICTDKFKNRYQVFIMSECDYIKMRNGSTDGVEIPQVDDGEVTEALIKQIKVRTVDNDLVVLPEGSTVLDFAFKIHNDFGFSCMYAYLNKSPNKAPIHTVLNDGDRIELVISRDLKNDQCINIAQLRWITYAKTEYAQKKLIKYFESKYE
ncbi:MAG: HD domain-containing protein [Clostridia bacterium]|jgi:GTP pyrophosphokinase|nr:HD domain-containing protein [Clostridia bacterium]MDD4275534.1 HD domain-containing protein [Clostridia bacterium]